MLFTGFGPFGDHDRNASWDVARAARDAYGPGADAQVVEVTYAEAARVGGQRLARRLVVAMGIAPYPEVRVECVGRNRAEGEPDVSGTRLSTPLDPAGPLARGLAAGLDGFADLLAAACPIPVVRSEDAGSYVCNALLYHLLRTTDFGGPPAVFVHVPQVDAAAASEIGRAVALAARAWIDRADDPAT